MCCELERRISVKHLEVLLCFELDLPFQNMYLSFINFLSFRHASKFQKKKSKTILMLAFH